MGIIPYRWFTQYLLGLLFVLVYIVLNNFKIKNSDIEKRSFYMLSIPNVIILIYTMIIMIFNIAIKYQGSYTRAIGLFIYAEIAICVGYISYKEFKVKAVDYTFWAFLINFIICVVLQINKSGFNSIINYIFNNSTTMTGMIIEAHELAATIPLFFAYYCMEKNIKFKKLKILLCVIVVIIAKKRIVFPAMAIAVLIIFVLKFKKYKKIIIKTICWSSLIIMYVYIILIKTEILFNIFDTVNFMGRQQIWNGISENYDLSIGFLGNGSGFTQKWLELNSFNLDYNVTHVIGALHNDTLRMYIEYGFFGFTAYMVNYLILNSRRVEKWNSLEVSGKYSIYAVIQAIIWFVDNVSTYFNFQIVFSIIIILAMCHHENNELETEKKEVEADENLYRKN